MTDLTYDLPFQEGFSISSPDVQANIVRITLEPRADAAMVCSACGHNCAHVHKWRWRQMRDMPMFGRYGSRSGCAGYAALNVDRVPSSCPGWAGMPASPTVLPNLPSIGAIGSHCACLRANRSALGGRPCAGSIICACRGRLMRCQCLNRRNG